MLAVASAVAYGLIIKKLSSHYPPITIIAWQNLMALAFFLPFFLWFDMHKVISVPLNLRLTTSLLALAIFASSLAFILFVRMIREIGLSKSNVLANLIPLITGLAALVLGQEEFGGLKILGMAIVLAGVILSQLQTIRRKEKLPTSLPQIPPQ
jgi:drug/metabolite transporter (DMT)-like permease